MPSEDGYDYVSYSPIELPEDGRVPELTLPVSSTSLRDFDTNIAVLDDVCNKASDLRRGQHQLATAISVTPEEVERGGRLWIQGHHSFFCVFALLAHAYGRLDEAATQLDWGSAREWAERVSALWTSAGALMIYACDFQPLMAIYGEFIRSKMPCAFSGFWLREWLAVRDASAAWKQTACQLKLHPEIVSLEAIVKKGRHAYDIYHKQVMLAAVPDGISLAQEYRRLNGGCPHSITQNELVTYDRLFRVNRVPQSPLRFMHVACRTFSETIQELAGGNRLSQVAIEDVVLGFLAAVRIFGGWFGPIPTTSRYYPRTWRGE